MPSYHSTLSTVPVKSAPEGKDVGAGAGGKIRPKQSVNQSDIAWGQIRIDCLFFGSKPSSSDEKRL
jgi:hypothetical protein